MDSKQVTIAVVGLGYVGLPLAIAFVKKGCKVVGVEVDNDRLKRLKKKVSYITDVTNKELRAVVGSRRFFVTGDFGVLRQSDVVIICVPTPLKRKYHPDISFIKKAVQQIGKNLKQKALIILESTTYPGTTEEVILPLLSKLSLEHGKDFYLAFSPERIDPGNKDFPVHKIPKVVGGINRDATILAQAVYQLIINQVVPVSSARVAEAVKLLENTFRLINIGLIDEMAMMAHKMKIDIWEVIAAAKTKPFGFMPFYPGPGVGGHCIPKDPLYLYWKAKHFGFRSRFIKLASDMINVMPGYIVQRVEEVLKSKGKKLANSKLLVLGVTYKKDIKDLRKSPSIDVISILQQRGVRVSFHDPLIPFLKLNGLHLESVRLTQDVIKRFDAVIIGTDHSHVDYALLKKHAAFIFDARNVFHGCQEQHIHVL
ncbi:MAG: nucleotide sugar dehydrogenase [Candidatus Omnitrophica bacterium]|nr:nucleotide sugar dehydrogenase [Candidatus Omnitrophota bacterium]